MKNNLLRIHCPHILFDSITCSVQIMILTDNSFHIFFQGPCFDLNYKCLISVFFGGIVQVVELVYLLTNLDFIGHKPIYPQTNLRLEIEQFSKMTRTRNFQF